MFKKTLGIILVSIFVSGCSTKFVYDHPVGITNVSCDSATSVVVSVKDSRSTKEIDKIYYGNPINDIHFIFKEELLNTGLFSEVISNYNNDTLENQESDFVIMLSLLAMDWNVPDYDQICTNAFMISLLTGGIGGVIYGSTDTDVYGDTTLRIKTIDTKTGEVLINKIYDGHCEIEKTKLTCDTPNTKATMVGESLEAAIDKFKVDLIKELSEQKADSVSSLNSPSSANQQVEQRAAN